jgi:ketosteroid isomerase-like protein
MSLEQNKAVVQRLFDAINNGTLYELPQLVAPDVVDHNAVIFMQPEGPGGAMEGIRMLLQGFPHLHLTIQELLAEGDQVVPGSPCRASTPATTEGCRRRPSSISRARQSRSSGSLTAGLRRSGAPPTGWAC